MNAILMALYTLILRRDRDGGGDGGRGYEPPVLWMNMARGIRTVIGGAYYGLLERGARIVPLLVARPVVHAKGQLGLGGGGGDGRGVLQFLVDVNPDAAETEAIRAVYVECVRYLEGLLLAVRTGETEFDIRKRFSSFPSMMPELFFEVGGGEEVPRVGHSGVFFCGGQGSRGGLVAQGYPGDGG
ncbi:uncharacterized protein BO80DRAFT_487026 [Aspergillus ibericus CBS 121593]|uniref:Uncharacterized protein n=1 Tax=Aspergillus ibericus CBS 121593 TaxID=1448316 RepID=A0A395GIZ4_9EURO|nr:hypothetical protein BO80DRAFT_487026 [Aspergillus ibericus CBS 121593]RAK95445.1 hypothetical protein BO80DRAFT_487026 [Aspergillus ibericus CBS 121593]